MARPYIGPRVDFRIPEEVKECVEADADRLGIPRDEHYRNILMSGWESVRAARPARVGAGAR